MDIVRFNQELRLAWKDYLFPEDVFKEVYVGRMWLSTKDGIEKRPEQHIVFGWPRDIMIPKYIGYIMIPAATDICGRRV